MGLQEGYGYNNTNLAYDLSRFENQEKEDSARRRDRESREARKIMLKSRSLSRSGSRIKIIAVCGLIFAALCAVNINNTRSDEWARMVAEQKEVLNEVQEQNALLQSKLDSKANIGYIEEYAADTLGMSKISHSQIDYLELNTENLIETQEDVSNNIFSSIAEWFKDILEYIGL